MIVIHTYGKVASTSLRSMLESQFPGEVFYTHSLYGSMLGTLNDFIARAKTDTSGLRNAIRDNAAINERLAASRESGAPVTIITGVRDPLVRSLSLAIQLLTIAFDDCMEADPAATALKLGGRIHDCWTSDAAIDDALQAFAKAAVRAPFNWFAEELEEPFGFDVLAHPFDFERGYVILERDNVRLLLYRQECAPDAVQAGLQALFPDKTFVLPRQNVSNDKPEALVYEHLKMCFRLPHEVLVDIYQQPYVRHFLSAEEISASIGRWQVVDEATAGRQEHHTPRATVIVTVHNHRKWVGALLDSLFAQWRPDLELLVIDDGSSDGSLDAVRERLDVRPDVRCTYLRNERALGLGVLPQLLTHSAGEIFIQADSDDLALPGRIDAILACFDRDSRCRLVTSNALKMSADGLAMGIVDPYHGNAVMDDPMLPASQAGSDLWLGASSAFHRALLVEFPRLDPELCAYGLDLLLAFRAALIGTHHYLARPLVAWRQHAGNSHRLEGALERDSSLAERHEAHVLTVLAQKVRDAEFLLTSDSSSALLHAVLDRCRRTFFDRFESWSRLRSRLRRQDPGLARAGAQDNPFVPPVPPIGTLAEDVRMRFGREDGLGAIVSSWTGFHQPERAGVWTAHTALVAFRVGIAEGTVTLALNGLPYLPEQRVLLSVDFGPPVEVRIAGADLELISLPVQRRDRGRDHLVLLIEAPDAVAPAQLDVGNPDQRLLGVMLHWIELSRRS